MRTLLSTWTRRCLTIRVTSRPVRAYFRRLRRKICRRGRVFRQRRVCRDVPAGARARGPADPPRFAPRRRQSCRPTMAISTASVRVPVASHPPSRPTRSSPPSFLAPAARISTARPARACPSRGEGLTVRGRHSRSLWGPGEGLGAVGEAESDPGTRDRGLDQPYRRCHRACQASMTRGLPTS